MEQFCPHCRLSKPVCDAFTRAYGEPCKPASKESKAVIKEFSKRFADAMRRLANR